MKKISVVIISVFLIIFIISCTDVISDEENNPGGQTTPAPNNPAIPTELLSPSEFIYLGAFRLPEGTSETKTWAWGGGCNDILP